MIKKKLEFSEIENFILNLKAERIAGVNVTVPFKKEIIPYLDELSIESKITQSVNTICFENNKIKGHNTDIEGFRLAIQDLKIDIKNKKILILGAGGVVSSLIAALNKMQISGIMLMNRTLNKAANLKKLFKNLNIIEWGELPDFDIIINATSIGLDKDDKLDLDFSKIGKNKFFYDVIYNPDETNFLKMGKKLGHKVENGKRMFIYQALMSFNLWHGIKPHVNNEVIKLLDE